MRVWAGSARRASFPLERRAPRRPLVWVPGRRAVQRGRRRAEDPRTTQRVTHSAGDEPERHVVTTVR